MKRLILICLWLVSTVASAEVKSIDEFTANMQRQSGFVAFYYHPDSGKLYLQIDQLQQPFLFQSSLPQGIGSNDIGLDRGQLGATRLVEFERFGDKVLLKQLNTRYRASSDNPAEQASVDEAFADSVIAGLHVVAQQQGQVLVDYTDFLLSDIHGIADRLKRTQQGNYQADKDRSGVYLARSKAFEKNTELEALVTFSGSQAGEYVRQVTPAESSISVHLHHSLIALPDGEFEMRRFHPYSGFWKMSYYDYSVPIDADMEQKFIPRHRLQKKDPSAAVSEAVEPIVYYLDPGIPEPIQSALLEGAMWWNSAFEKIGYRDAFQVKVLPEGADPMDVRYNVIQWVHRATRGWSYGSSVVDPRTGEIIKGHVTLGSLRVRQDYLIALGLTSPFSGVKSDTEKQQQMALARIRQLSAHEVGHTLGIAHNFAASAQQRASVMDYPHPLLSLADGKVSLDQAYAVGMGEWDNYVIAYGYQDLPDGDDPSDYLADLVSQAHQQGLAYQSDPDSRPRHAANADGHLWDNGADPIAQLQHLFSVRDTALQQFGINTLAKGAALASLQEMLVPIYYLHRYQAEAVAKLIGGVNYAYEMKDDFVSPRGVTPVSAERQQLALQTLLSTLKSDFLLLPSSLTKLITPKVYGDRNNRESFNGRNGLVFDPVSAAEAAAGHTLSLLLQPQRLNRLVSQPNRQNGQITLDGLLERLFSATIQQRPVKQGLQVAQRVNHTVLNAVILAMQAEQLAPEARAFMLVEVIQLHDWLNKNKRHEQYRAMAKQLEWFLSSGEWQGFEIKSLPPGSPI